jgi:hypothetical protein
MGPGSALAFRSLGRDDSFGFGEIEEQENAQALAPPSP